MIPDGTEGVETTQINPGVMVNCSDRGNSADGRKQRGIIDLERHGHARQPRENPA